MTLPKLSLVLCLSMVPAAALAAAPRDHATEPAASAAVGEPAGGAESLPDLPPVQARRLSFGAQTAMHTDRTSRISFAKPHSEGVSPLASMPLAGTAHRLAAGRFNTDDGSMLDDFAICYRISGRSSIEIIPGDPAPVKLPVVSIANSTGVTVGLVVRLAKQ